MIYFLTGDVCAELDSLPAESFDSLVSDFPYGLSREPDPVEVLRHWLADDLREHARDVLDGLVPGCDVGLVANALFPSEPYHHGGGGFMGKTWDSFVPGPEVWRSIFRVLKPGAYVAVFGGTRTYDLLVLGARIAGFEIRDQLDWLYGSGFPKSLDVSKAIDKAAGAEREVIGVDAARAAKQTGKAGTAALGDFAGSGGQITAPATDAAKRHAGKGTALKPAHEPILLARKPLRGTVAANVLAYGTGAINVDACRVGWASDADKEAGRPASLPKARRGLDGSATFAMRDRSGEDPVAAQATAGRWPANVLLDPDAAAILDEQAGERRTSKPGTVVRRRAAQDYASASIGAESRPAGSVMVAYGDSGGASRFFYQAKAAKGEREAGLAEAGAPVRTGGQLTDREDGSDGLKSPRAGAGRGGGRRNPHPTVKPIELIRWLARLVTPAGGTVLVPFSGVGSEVIACGLEGFHAVGVELDPEYVAIARARTGHHLGLPELTAEAREWWRARAHAASAAVGWLLGAAGSEIVAWGGQRRAA